MKARIVERFADQIIAGPGAPTGPARPQVIWNEQTNLVSATHFISTIKTLLL